MKNKFNFSDFAHNLPTIVDILRWRADNQTDRMAFTYLVNGETKSRSLTYGDLYQLAQTVGAWLQTRKMEGERVIILYPSGLEYIAVLMGCFYAGAVAVPLYPPKHNHNLSRLKAIIEDAQARVGFAPASVISEIKELFSQDTHLAGALWVSAEDISQCPNKEGLEPHVTQHTLALLQYTSGSTSLPKGVMMSHRNIMHNERMIQSMFKQTDESIIVSWLPLYHDMGLIGTILQPLYVGAPCIFMSPSAFLQDPLRWLQAISRYKATTSGAPNFAYDLCARKASAGLRTTLDLNSWKVAFNGSEPVRLETLETFANTFKSCGFRKEAFYPCYGLAEATLMVAGKHRDGPPQVKHFQANALKNNKAVEVRVNSVEASALVSCGRPHRGQQIMIVHPDDFSRCQPLEVGEIWVAGSSVTKGYWKQPEETANLFCATPSGGGKKRFLRTGDMGFLMDGELFVTGRLKDMIVIRGSNYYPQDIELTVGKSHSACLTGNGAAFSVEVDSEERLVVVQEVKREQKQNLETVIDAIRQEIAKNHELHAYAIVLIRKGRLPKTSSGKIQRRACKEAFLAGSLDILTSSNHISDRFAIDNILTDDALRRLGVPSAGEVNDWRSIVETYLQKQAVRILNISPSQLSVHQALNSLGLDSLMAAELKSRIEADLGVVVPITELLRGISIKQLVSQVLHQPTTTTSPSDELIVLSPQLLNQGSLASLSGQEATDGYLQVSLDQERLWFLDQLMPESPFYNLVNIISLKGCLHVQALEQSVDEILKRHESLRANFISVKGRPLQIINPATATLLPIEDLRALTESGREKCVRQMAEAEVARPFNLAEGPLWRIKLTRLAEEEHVIFFTIHHIIADYWSITLFVNELAYIYEALLTGTRAELPELRMRYADFIYRQRQSLQSDSYQYHLSFWKKYLETVPPPLIQLEGGMVSKLQPFQRGHCFFDLSPDTYESLRKLSCDEAVTLFTILLAGFKLTLHCFFGREDIIVGCPVKGRPDSSTEDLIGYFAHPMVIRTDLSGDPTFQELVMRVRKEVLSVFDHQEVPFVKIVEVLRHNRNTYYNPLFQVMFSFVKAPAKSLRKSRLIINLEDIWTGTMGCPLFLTVAEAEQGAHVALDYAPDLFDPNAVTSIINTYGKVLDKCAQNSRTVISQMKLAEELDVKSDATDESTERQTIIVASTFTAEPLSEALTFWVRELGFPTAIEFAPFNQIFQQLLDSSSLVNNNRNGVNVILIRYEDWLRCGSEIEIVLLPAAHAEIERNIREFIIALRAAVSRSAVPFVICLCPASTRIARNTDFLAFFEKLNSYISDELSNVSGIYIINSSQVMSTYPVINYYDEYRDELSSIPFTADFFIALGTSIARKIYTIKSVPYKVIVLDCDQTLWKGYCAEDGPFGVEIQPMKAFQEFMVAQHQAGMLICLCSKNNEADVIEVFERNTDMVLRRDHLVAFRINWKPKSENIKSLSEELQLALDSFIFIDDDPIECEEMRLNCPEILTLQLPRESNNISTLLAHTWAFDHLEVTEVNKLRTTLYHRNAQREQLRKESLTLDSFIRNLGLKVQISELSPEHLARASELTYRTSQFNITRIRRSTAALQMLCQSDKFECLVVDVRDRFGEYGVVGLIIYEIAGNAMEVDTFLLSCRALGRGVEYQMLAKLGAIANQRGANNLNIPFVQSERNQSAYLFLCNVGERFKRPTSDGWIFEIPTEVISLNQESPSPEFASSKRELNGGPIITPPAISSGSTTRYTSHCLNRIATGLFNVGRIMDEINAQKKSKVGQESVLSEGSRTFKGHVEVANNKPPKLQETARLEINVPFAPPSTPTEKTLASIWSEILGHERIGVRDNFFELGGHSLLATQLMARVHEVFDVKLPLIQLFEAPTIAELASSIEGALIKELGPEELGEIIGELDKLSDEEVEQLLAHEG